MKNKIFYIFLIISFVMNMNLLYSASEPFDASIELVRAITITEATAMDFGIVSIDNTAGTIVIDTLGSISGTGGYVEVSPESLGATAASFAILGTANKSISITLQNASETLSGSGTAAGESLTLGTFVTNPSGTTTLNGVGAATVTVGGTVTFGAAQVAGPYSGTATLVVNYN